MPSEIDEGAWEFRFVVSEEFNGSELVFNRFVRYRLDPIQVSVGEVYPPDRSGRRFRILVETMDEHAQHAQ